MKKILLTLMVFYLLSGSLKTQAQDYYISFTAIGSSTTLEHTKVDNLTTGDSVTLNGGDVLHLSGTVGIGTLTANSKNIQLYPNPAREQATLTFSAPENGNVLIRIVDLSGKTIVQTNKTLSSGVHRFQISGVCSGIYCVTVSGESYFYSAKLISQSNLLCEARIEFFSSDTHTCGPLLKSASATIDMPYKDGDRLLYKGVSGIYSTLITDVPDSSKTMTFNFAPCTDSDSNHYTTVTIGTQIWMAENLKVGSIINGNQSQTDNGVVEKYCFDNDASYCQIYGGLYQWSEMMQYVTTPGVKGICPSGWHVPTEGDWCILNQFIDSTVECGNRYWLGVDVGGKMKTTGTFEAGTGLWGFPNAGATNASGFTAIPSGFWNGSEFLHVGFYSFWWSSTEYGPYYAWYRNLWYYGDEINRDYELKVKGYSVRCVRN